VRSIIRAFGGVLAGTALVLGSNGIAVAEPQQDLESQATIGAIAWHPCPELAAVDCGTLSLPIDWAKPRGAKFDLAVARRKATDPSKRIGIMLINPGGPGGSGVDFALGADGYFSPEIQARFDIIGFDPRGVARSQPVKCSLDLLLKGPADPTNQAEFDKFVAYNKELQQDCRTQTGPMFDHADTLGVIQDMDAIRRSMGERKINYYGVSYGTIIGQQYAERYGDKIRAMVIDSNMDHSLGTKAFMDTEAVTAEDSFTEFVKWNARTESSPLHGKDVGKFWDDLLVRADKGEITVPDGNGGTRVLTSDEIRGRANGAFYGPGWKQLASALVALDAPQPTELAAFAGEAVENPFPAVFCQDYQLRIANYAEYARLSRSENRLAPHMRASPLGHGAATGCIGFPAKANNPQHRLDIRNAPKILMMNSLHDPATAYAWAANAHRQSRDTTVLLTYEGWGHGVYDRSDCTKGATDGYLVNLTVPRDGTRCAAVEPPALEVASATAPTLPKGPRPDIAGW
jgi:pimeloyl-ACP methyl ester carboxylesterase